MGAEQSSLEVASPAAAPATTNAKDDAPAGKAVEKVVESEDTSQMASEAPMTPTPVQSANPMTPTSQQSRPGSRVPVSSVDAKASGLLSAHRGSASPPTTPSGKRRVYVLETAEIWTLGQDKFLVNDVHVSSKLRSVSVDENGLTVVESGSSSYQVGKIVAEKKLKSFSELERARAAIPDPTLKLAY